MKTFFYLFFFTFLFASPSFACEPIPEANAALQSKACIYTPGCVKQCKKEIMEILEDWNLDSYYEMLACGKKACGDDLDCQEKFETLPLGC